MHQIETAQSFAKHGITDIAASILDDGACPFICAIRAQWQFKDEACGVLARHVQETTKRFAPLQGVFKGCVGSRPCGSALDPPA
jgi:hypothetical protein